MPTRGYQSSVSEILHVGLGESAIIDSVKIIWPGGASETVYDVKSDQQITLEQKNARQPAINQAASAKHYFSYQKPLIEFSHLQLEYNDFKRQPLMPVMFSQCGPQLKTGDLNKDGKEDIFIGGSQGQGSELFLQQEDGSFAKQKIETFIADSISTTSSIDFFDAENDGDIDIYVASGGYADYSENDERLQDRLFFNDGKGNFIRAPDALPKMFTSKSLIAIVDIDADGDTDIFAGGRVVPGEYPKAAKSYLLLNDGKGKFVNASEQWLGDFTKMGMITDAKWLDINNDKLPDLIIAGEWIAPTVLLNTGKKLEVAETGLQNYYGWWNTIELFDADKDGDMDIIAGNWGLNSQLKANNEEPIEMIWKDFDNNGSIDPFLCCYIQGKSFPYVSRDELLDQVYPMRRKFTSYKSYADALLQDMYTADELKDAGKLKATHLATTFFENRNGQFIERSLPIQAQFSPIYKIIVQDWNKDGHDDLLLLGNNEYPRLKMGKIDANFGTILINDGKGNFQFVQNKEHGLLVAGDVKDAAIIRVKNDRYLLIGINNADLINYKLIE